MSLTKTFDTHIKAISTAEEWGKYKEMINDMNAEEYILENGDHRKWEFGVVEQREHVAKLMEGYKNQTLQELKAKVERARDHATVTTVEGHRNRHNAFCEVITLIDEAINE